MDRRSIDALLPCAYHGSKPATIEATTIAYNGADDKVRVSGIPGTIIAGSGKYDPDLQSYEVWVARNGSTRTAELTVPAETLQLHLYEQN